MNKLTKNEIKEKFKSILDDEKIVDIDIYDNGTMANVIAIMNHTVIDYTIALNDDNTYSVYSGIMSSKKFEHKSIIWHRYNR